MDGNHQRIELLGTFGVFLDARSLEVPTTTARLLAVLALRDSSVTRSQVAGTLWPDVSECRAGANLRAIMWRLPAPVRSFLTVANTTLALVPGVEVDLHVARRVVRDVLDRDELTGCAADRVDLLCRPLLPDWDEEWLVFERERVRQLHIHALERLGVTLLERGDALSAVDVGAAIIGTEPLRESAHHLLVRAHLAAGNRADARRCYDRYCALVRTELGLEPAYSVDGMVPATTTA